MPRHSGFAEWEMSTSTRFSGFAAPETGHGDAKENRASVLSIFCEYMLCAPNP